MKRICTGALLAIALIATMSQESHAGNRRAQRVSSHFATHIPWHGGYSYTPYGEPTALVVPPTASSMTSWGWGVTGSEVRPLYHQFGRGYPGEGGVSFDSNPYLTTPRWPSHTDQFGVYPVRGPW